MGGRAAPARAAGVLFDRDGTLVVNVPHNADPGRVVALPCARGALDRIRATGTPMAVVSNQSVIGRGLATAEMVDATNARVEELVGPIGPFYICPHLPEACCRCRKPRPGLIMDAAAELGTEPASLVVIGDMGSDVAAARAAGASAILVPTAETPTSDVAAAEVVVPSLAAAVDLLFAGPFALTLR